MSIWKLTAVLVALFVSVTCIGQAGNITQWYSSPLYLNPALAGTGHSDVRLANTFRSQWNPIIQQTTVHLGLDKFQENWGYGAMFNKYSAGQGSIETNQVMASLARHLRVSDNGYFSLGFQSGFYQRSLDLTQAVFESQYNQETQLISSESGENISIARSVILDAGAGVHYRVEGPTNQFEAGISIGHIFQGNVSLYEDGTSFLPRRITTYATYGLYLDSALVLRPMLMHSMQGTARQLNALVAVEKHFMGGKKVAFGTGIRTGDALIFMTQLDLGQLTAGFSYDVNTSVLTRATGGFGAMEINVALRLGKQTNAPGQVVQPKRRQGQTNHAYDRSTHRIGKTAVANPRLADSDGDGVVDPSDHCPNTPGDPRNLGCPGKLDSDKDGVSDDVDLCPFITGLPMHQGCPDTDGDGIPDIDDRCPMLYGAYNLEGCPDSDRDGISDRDDRCPTLFGSLPNQGCPDDRQIVLDAPRSEVVRTQTHVAPGPVVERHYPQNLQHVRPDGTALVLDHFYVTFAQTSGDLDYEAKKQLRDYVVALGLNQEYRLLISIPVAGGTPFETELAEKRAHAVRDYLLDFGLGADRILEVEAEIAGRIAPNQTLDGTARDRRIQVMLVQ